MSCEHEHALATEGATFEKTIVHLDVDDLVDGRVPVPAACCGQNPARHVQASDEELPRLQVLPEAGMVAEKLGRTSESEVVDHEKQDGCGSKHFCCGACGCGELMYGRIMSQTTESLSMEELSFDKVIKEEQGLVRCKRVGKDASWHAAGVAVPPCEPFAVAFSGGGIRAAAFQAGVLWRLAEDGHMRNVDYLAAVSGGAYIASAFASHVHAEPQKRPPPSEERQWYLRIVARTICRMQKNAGEFVRDPAVAEEGCFGRPRDGAGMLPRVCDLPVLVLTLALTLILNPLQILVVYLVPIVEAMELFYGGGLRATFCAPRGTELWSVIYDLSLFGYTFRCFEIILLLNAVVFLLTKLPGFSLRSSMKEPKLKDGKLPPGFLTIHSLNNVLRRCCCVLFLVLALTYSMSHLQKESWRSSEEMCKHYIHRGHQDCVSCGDLMWAGQPWYQEDTFLSIRSNATDLGQSSQGTQSPPPIVRLTQPTQEIDMMLDLAKTIEDNEQSLLELFFKALFILLLFALLVFPFMKALIIGVLFFCIPGIYIVLMLAVVQYRIYAPITGERLFGNAFKSEHWYTFVHVCMGLNLAMVCFHNEIQRLFHKYYKKALKNNFFCDGKNVPLKDLRVDPHCPLLLLTGTVSDYKPGRSLVGNSEISFSPLHTGSERTGFLRTPIYRTLSKCTALAAAGCLDAVSFSMSSQLRMRFLQQAMNCGWGDFILFNPRESALIRMCGKRMPGKFKGILVGYMNQAPSLILWVTFTCLILVVAHNMQTTDGDQCRRMRLLFGVVIVGGIALFLLSFLTFIPHLHWVMFSPLIRQFHQLSRYQVRAPKPPGLVYVTDGGVRDCTGIVQLMRRRCRRILLVLANADPSDDLRVLRTAMEFASDEELGSFYDLDDPTRDVRILFEEYMEDKAKPFLHLGIRYGWLNKVDPSSANVEGARLVIVKNRLPPVWDVPVRPLLTEEEICGKQGTPRPEPGSRDARFADLLETDLGGLGCCDCCHLYGCNCGGKFPHLTGANYLWLSPRLFSSLCRLGHDISAPAIAKVLEAVPPVDGSPDV